MSQRPSGRRRTLAMPGRWPEALGATVAAAGPQDLPSEERASTSFWLWAPSVSSDQWQTSVPSSRSANSGSHRPPWLRATAPVTTVERYFQVRPPSALDQTGMDMGLVDASPPTEADQRSEPAGRAATARGSSQRVA